MFQFAFAGLSNVSLSRAVGISPNTFRRAFTEELATARAQRRAEIIGMLWTTARAGKVSAAKQLLDMMDRAEKHRRRQQARLQSIEGRPN